MDTKLFLETDATDSLIYKMRETANVLYDRTEMVYLRLAWIQWEGQSRDDYLFQLHRCTSNLKSLADQLDLLGFQLALEVEKWLAATSKFGS